MSNTTIIHTISGPLELFICSDLHLEMPLSKVPTLPPGEGKIIGLLGDIGKPCQQSQSYERFIKSCIEDYKFERVLIIIGNHEFYGGEYYSRKQKIKEIVQSFPDNKVLVLDQNSLLILEEQTNRKIRILGCTLWSNIPSRHERDISRAISDYMYITIQKGEEETAQKLTVQDTNQFHRDDVEWLVEELEKCKENGEEVVILTHHAPLISGTSHPRHNSSIYCSAFSTNLQFIMDKFSDEIKVWGFGHTHYSNSIQVGKTLLVSNQQGYRVELDNEKGFNSNLILKI
ncbi:hypothetical protein FDP41_008406 [Naegleria fowleri]|uniref:Calcineurin-like phosphoesterase domain-containing protein n=1 Tax=Naegleria fowleri TaxID=5763 RepID=A0A6A5BJF6_NAEFO|nr:uncharacterized protein FDP41_008406 [Naegleria fowleri]KAF0973199.1 hypothetical protein FDP41_008406 [Naegleria fowleri]